MWGLVGSYCHGVMWDHDVMLWWQHWSHGMCTSHTLVVGDTSQHRVCVLVSYVSVVCCARRAKPQPIPTGLLSCIVSPIQVKYVTIAGKFVKGVKPTGEGSLLQKFAGAGYQQVR